MRKLSRPEFIRIIDNDEFINATKVNFKSIPYRGVVEFQIRNKYFYKLNTDFRFGKYLAAIHSRLNNLFLNSIELNSSAKAFRKGYSYTDLFTPHVDNYFFLRIDIKSFFHSITNLAVHNDFSSYFRDDYLDDSKSIKMIDYFVFLTTLLVEDKFQNVDFRGKFILPMGFSTSPLISNIIFRSLDIQISKLCMDYDIVYTRYADDLLFSSRKSARPYIHSDVFFDSVKSILSQKDFSVHPRKTISSTHTLSINGYTIQNGAKNEFRLSNKKLKKVSKLIYEYKKDGDVSRVLKCCFDFDINTTLINPHKVDASLKYKYNLHQLINKSAGFRAYLLSFIKSDLNNNIFGVHTKNKYISLINDLQKIIVELHGKL